MFGPTIHYYDLIHSYKDYAQEAQKLSGIIRSACPKAQTILDVACGTGEHARFLSNDFQVEGIDVESAFVQIAQRKVPTARFHVGDMRTFELHKRYDAILCLFSSIAYLTESCDVVHALSRFGRHLSSDGILLVEPWFTPDRWHFDRSWLAPALNDEATKVCGMTTSRQRGSVCVLDFHYLIGVGSRISRLEEHHELGMYTIDEMCAFFDAADLDVSYKSDGLNDRGLYVARHRR